jgi:hypothetical protein
MLRKFVAPCAVACVLCLVFPALPGVSADEKTEKEMTELAVQVRALLKENCYACHGDPEFKSMGKINYILDHKRVTSKLVDLKKPEESDLYIELNEGNMPRVFDKATGKTSRKKLPQEKIDLVLDWIKAGAPAWPEPLRWVEVSDVNIPYTNLCEGPDGKLLCIALRIDGDKTSVYDFKEWKLLDAPGPSAASQMAFDSKRKVTVAFDLKLQQTWEFSTKWTKVTTKNSPDKREHTQIAYDGARGVVVLYGGMASGGGTLTDTWEYNGKDWSSKETTGKPAAGAGCMAYDAKNKVCVLHGGAQNETWTFDGKDWVQKSTSNSPGGRNYAGACYDPVGQRVLLYGGSKDRAVNHELWAFDGADWTLLLTEGALPKSNGAFIYYNTGRKKLYLCAGTMHTMDLK